MNYIMPETSYTKEYTKHFYNYQPTCEASVLYEDFKMDANQNDSEDFRSIPPLIPMKPSPPPLCNIPREMRGNNSFEFNRFSNMQERHDYNASFSKRSLAPIILPSSPPIHNTAANTNHTITNTRKRKSENTNRELIDMVKKQLEQLNKTLAALERNNDCDSDMPEGQLTPPSDGIDQLKDDTLQQRGCSNTYCNASGGRYSTFKERNRSCCQAPETEEDSTLTLSSTDNSRGSVEHYQQKNSPTSSNNVSMSTSNTNCNVYSSRPCKQALNAVSHFHSDDKKDNNKKEKLEHTGSKKLTSLCQVCGDQAPEHIHYGSVSCFSCRAFFRRSVCKSHMYVCPGNKRCSIMVTTRKNCQYCRYQTCLRSGMRPTWVLTDKEKQERIKNKKSQKELMTTVEDKNKHSDDDTDVGKPVNSNSGNQTLYNICNFTAKDDGYIEELLSAQRATVCNEVFGKHVAHAIAKCIQIDIGNMAALSLPRWATLEVFRLQYSRFSSFGPFISEFALLNKKTQDILLHNNLGAIAIIKLAHIFKPRLEISDNNTTHSMDANLLSFTAQLCELGFDNKMANNISSQSATDPVFLTLKQLFHREWTKDSDHSLLHHKTFDVLNGFIKNDSTLALLFQIVNLFNTSNIGPELEPTERKTIDSIQERWTVLLHGYYHRKYGYSKSIVMLPKVIYLMFELKLLSEKNRYFNGE